jgi:hypothetical protein
MRAGLGFQRQDAKNAKSAKVLGLHLWLVETLLRALRIVTAAFPVAAR